MVSERDKVEAFLFAVALVCIIALMLVGGAIGGKIANAHWQREAVKHGAAEYDSQTGVWQWKDSKPNSPSGQE